MLVPELLLRIALLFGSVIWLDGLMVMVVVLNPAPEVPDQIVIPDSVVEVGTVRFEAPAVPEIVIPLVPVIMETCPAPAMVLKFKELPVLLMKIGLPVPELLPLVITAVPDKFNTLIALMV